MLTKAQFASRLKNACQCVIDAQEELTRIDAIIELYEEK